MPEANDPNPADEPGPDSPTTDQVASFDGQTESETIRLGCIHCDRNDCDGVEVVPADWQRVSKIQNWLESVQPVEQGDKSGRCAVDWQTHLGICPECFAEFECNESPRNVNSESTDSAEVVVVSSLRVHPIIRQIIDRDCHVGESSRDVVRHVISKLRNGYEAFRQMPRADRRRFVQQCVQHHRSNLKTYVKMMSGFTRTLGKVDEVTTSLSGQELVGLIRKHKLTIESLAFRLGTSQKRVRQIRDSGLTDPLAVRDWIEAVTGDDPGPLPAKYRINNARENGKCCFCGFPLGTGDAAYEYVGDIFCSINCCRKSRGW